MLTLDFLLSAQHLCHPLIGFRIGSICCTLNELLAILVFFDCKVKY